MSEQDKEAFEKWFGYADSYYEPACLKAWKAACEYKDKEEKYTILEIIEGLRQPVLSHPDSVEFRVSIYSAIERGFKFPRLDKLLKEGIEIYRAKKESLNNGDKNE